VRHHAARRVAQTEERLIDGDVARLEIEVEAARGAVEVDRAAAAEGRDDELGPPLRALGSGYTSL